jgi:hypothetical protein
MTPRWVRPMCVRYTSVGWARRLVSCRSPPSDHPPHPRSSSSDRTKKTNAQLHSFIERLARSICQCNAMRIRNCHGLSLFLWLLSKTTTTTNKQRHVNACMHTHKRIIFSCLCNVNGSSYGVALRLVVRSCVRSFFLAAVVVIGSTGPTDRPPGVEDGAIFFGDGWCLPITIIVSLVGVDPKKDGGFAIIRQE